MTAAEQNIATTIAYAVRNKKADLSNLLRANGYMVILGIADANLIDATVEALKDPEFQNAFLDWVNKGTRGYSNAGGYYENNSSILNDYSAPANSSVSTTQGGASTSFWGDFNANSAINLLTTGAGIFGSIKASDANANAIKAQANAQLAAAQAAQQAGLTQLEIAKLQYAASQNPKTNNTLLWVFGGILLAGVVGFTVYAVTKKSA